MKFGTCKLCQNESDLNFEHVPPRNTGNKTTRYKKGSFLDFMTSEDPSSYSAKGKVLQGGIVYYSYCIKCNNFLGTEYVRYYKKWFSVGIDLLQETNMKGVAFQALKLHPLRILKQVLGMFVAINPISCFSQNTRLLEFLMNPESKDFPEEIRVFCYLNDGPNWRFIELISKGNFNSGQVLLGSEITFPPFGYVLVLNHKEFKNDLLTEITDFHMFDINEEVTLNFKMNKLETHFPILLDYRSRDEIENQ